MSMSSFCKLPGLKELLNRGGNSDSCTSLPVGPLHRGRDESWGVGQGKDCSGILLAGDMVNDGLQSTHLSHEIFVVSSC